MNNKNYAGITEALFRMIAKSDEEFQEQIASGIGVSLETLQDYLDNVKVSDVIKVKYTIEDFGKGNQVNVERRDGDQFNNDFTGTIIGIHHGVATVEDQDGDCWDCDPEQLTFNSDE
jgi:hypothetical protein